MGIFPKRKRKRKIQYYEYDSKEKGSPNQVIGEVRNGRVTQTYRIKKAKIKAPLRSEVEFPILAETNDNTYVTCDVVIKYTSDLQSILDGSEISNRVRSELETRLAKEANSKIKYDVKKYSRDELETEKAQSYLEAQLQSKLSRTIREELGRVRDLYLTPFKFHKNKPHKKLKRHDLEKAKDVSNYYHPLGTKGIGASDLEAVTKESAREFATLLVNVNPQYSSDRVYWTEVWTQAYTVCLEREAKKPHQEKSLVDYISKREVRNIMKQVHKKRRSK